MNNHRTQNRIVGIGLMIAGLMFAYPVQAQVNAPASMGAYGGATLFIETMAIPNEINKTRVFVATLSANSVFYADVDHSLANPFGTNLFFRTAPGLGVAGNHGTVNSIAAHAPSGRLFVGDDEGLFSCITNTDSFVTNSTGYVAEVLIQGSYLFFTEMNYSASPSIIINLHYGTLNGVGAFTENPASPYQLAIGDSDAAGTTLAVHPTNNFLYVAFHRTNLFLKSSTTYDAFSGATVFTPFGVSSTVSNWLDPAAGFRPLTFGPDGRMFLSAYDSGLAMENVTYSDDDGATWSAPVATSGGQVIKTVGSATTYTVYSGRGISTNKGVDWAEFGSHIPGARVITGTAKPIAPDPYYPQIVYCISERGAGVTTNSGLSELANISRGIEALIITDFDVTRSKNIAWTATMSGLYHATNFNVSPQWNESVWPAGEENCRSIGLDKSDPNGTTVFVGGFYLSKTTDGGGANGTNWVRVFTPTNYGVPSLAIVSAVKANGNIVFAGCYGPYDSKGGLFKSTDGGSNWIAVTLQAGGVDVNDILLTEENGATVAYVAVARDDSVTAGSGLYRIVGDTVSHEVSDPVSIRDVAMSSSNTIYASGLDANTNVVVYQKVGSTTAWVWRTLALTNYPAYTYWSSSLWCGGIGPVITIGLDSSSNEAPYLTANEYVSELSAFRYSIYYLSSTSSAWQTSSALSYPVGSQIYVIYWDDLVVGTTIGLYGQSIQIDTNQPVATVLADPVIVSASGGWYVWFSGSGYQMGGPWNLGGSGTPVAGDFDGDHYADPAMVDQDTGVWSVWFSSLGYQMGGPWNLGVSGTPVAADFDGDGYADPAMENLGNWYVWFTSLGYQMGGPYYLGGSGTPVAGDFDGDYYADPAMVDSAGAWCVWFTSLGYQMGGPYYLGGSGMPVAGDFDGDGYADPAMVDTAGAWRVWYTSLGYQMGGPYSLGVSGTPLAGDFDGR